MPKHLLPLLALLTACTAPTYKFEDEPTLETFQCGGYLEDEGLQYYYETTIFEDGSVFVSGAVSDGVLSSSGTHFYAPGEPRLGLVTVYKEGWLTMRLVLVPQLGVQFSRADRNWMKLGGCEHTFH